MNTLHIGKLTDECKTTVTPAFHDMLIERARQASCNPSDLVRDALYLVFTGISHTEHVANDRRAVMSLEGLPLGDKAANE